VTVTSAAQPTYSSRRSSAIGAPSVQPVSDSLSEDPAALATANDAATSAGKIGRR